jgi:hypothetical protein
MAPPNLAMQTRLVARSHKETLCPLMTAAGDCLLENPTHVASWSACRCQLEAGH